MKEIILAIGITIITLSLLTLMAYQHELTHYTINKQTGLNSTIIMRWDGGTTEYTINPQKQQAYNNFQLAHSINEIIGYQIMPLLTIITGLMTGIFTIQLIRLRQEREKYEKSTER